MTTGQLNVTRRRRCLCGDGGVGGVETSRLAGCASAVGGRPLLGGCATWTSGGDRQGLSRRVENVSSLFPTCSLKYRRDLLRTR